MLKKISIGLIVFLIFGAAVFFVFDPLERLREARDNTRINDLTNLKNAIDVYISNNAKDIAARSNLLCATCNNPNLVYSYRKINLNSVATTEKQSTYVNGTGWVPLDLALNARLGQTPLHLLPLDPLETGYNIRTKLPFFSKQEDFVYTFTAKGDKYKLTAKMESKKGLEKAANDGGDLPDRIEMGTDLTLKP